MYTIDGRLPIDDIFKQCDAVFSVSQWDKTTVKYGHPKTGEVTFYNTNKSGPSLWLLAGIHGEEPAGTCAMVKSANEIATFAKNIPTVVIPVCNQPGYVNNLRYLNGNVEDLERGVSIGYAGHLLPQLEEPSKPRNQKPLSEATDVFLQQLLQLTTTHPPKLVLDFHEDEDLTLAPPYIFSQGRFGYKDPVANKIVDILLGNEMALQLDGSAPTGETVHRGILGYEHHDGSVDELLAAPNIVINNEIKKGPHAQTVVVLETPSVSVPLLKRTVAYQKVIDSLDELWCLVDTK